MEEGGGPDDVDFGIHAGEVMGCGRAERIDGEEVAVQGAAVEEEVVAEVDELAVDVDAVEPVGGHAVEDELAQVLRETAA